jgi:hypothetical protein
MNVHLLAPLVAALALAAAILRLLTAGGEPPQLDPPGWDGRAVQAVSVELPPIRDFEHYYPNDKNPFVPYSVRQREEQALKRPEARAQVPFEPFTIPDQQPRVIEKPAFVAPRPATGVAVPVVVGLVRLGSRSRVSLALDDTMYPLQVGESAAGWTLIGVERGQVVVESADGDVLRLAAPATASEPVDLSIGRDPVSAGAGGGLGDIEPPTSEDPVVQQAIDEIARNPAAIFRYRQDEELWRRISQDPSVQAFMRENPELIEMLER